VWYFINFKPKNLTISSKPKMPQIIHTSVCGILLTFNPKYFTISSTPKMPQIIHTSVCGILLTLTRKIQQLAQHQKCRKLHIVQFVAVP
jgi:hypothetical protein